MTEEELQNRVILNIKKLRKEKGLSQEKLADAADLSRQMMNDIEGKRRFLTKGTMVKLANALECDVHEFFIPTSEESPEAQDLYKTVGSKIAGELQSSINEILERWK